MTVGGSSCVIDEKTRAPPKLFPTSGWQSLHGEHGQIESLQHWTTEFGQKSQSGGEGIIPARPAEQSQFAITVVSQNLPSTHWKSLGIIGHASETHLKVAATIGELQVKDTSVVEKSRSDNVLWLRLRNRALDIGDVVQCEAKLLGCDLFDF